MDASALRADAAPPLVVDGLSQLADRYDLLLCDLWGVMHDGTQAAAGAIDAVSRFRAKGGAVIFITNAPRPRDAIEAQIGGLGIPAEAYDGIVTSGDVTIAAIAAAGDKGFYHIGPPRDLALFEATRRQTGRAARLTPLGDADCVVVTGLFDDRTETPADYAGPLAAMRERDLPMICANPDVVVHVGDTLIYCGGALAEAYRALGGTTILAGKPHPPIYEAALAMAVRETGRTVERSRVLAIGDGMITDVAGAANEGLDVLFITTGIHRDDFHVEGTIAPEPTAYAGRLAALSQRPFAAMPQLVW
jgi:HAD superfamily hydrolase (TIGR01459 family)